jgi:hypothetical protein
MVRAVRHLQEAKIDEVAERLRGEGYVVRRGADAGRDEGFDLLAEKDGRVVAIQVTDAVELRSSSRDVLRLRDLAAEKGFQDFRLIVVNPPNEKEIAVPGLDAILLKWVTDAPPEPLKTLADRIMVKRVHGVDVDSITIESDGAHVVGSAVVAVELDYGTPGADDAIGLSAEFPIHFDLRLDRDLGLRERLSLTAETASFAAP